MPRKTLARLVKLILAAALVVPAIGVSARPALGCSVIWGTNTTVQKSDSSLTGRTFTGKVVYRVGLDQCRLVPIYITVVSFTETVTFSLGQPAWWHGDYERNVHAWFNGFTDYTTSWHDATQIDHVGDGTWSRTVYPNKTVDYYPTVAVSSQWLQNPGNVWTKWAYQFKKGVILSSY
jgi:hypothetical protein